MDRSCVGTRRRLSANAGGAMGSRASRFPYRSSQESCVPMQGCSLAGSGLPECRLHCFIDCDDACLSNVSSNVWQQVHFLCIKPGIPLVLLAGSSVKKVNRKGFRTSHTASLSYFNTVHRLECYFFV